MPDQVLLLSAGQNVSAPPGPWNVRLQPRPGIEVDLCALLVGADGKVAGDDDFVFYNAPSHASGAVTLTADPASAGLRIDPGAAPSSVARIVIAATVEVGGSWTGMSVQLHGAGTGPTLAFAPAQLETVSTAVLLEVYRRAGSWKVRAVGQGWATGLAGLATDYGIAVDDDSGDREPDVRRDAGPHRRPDSERASEHGEQAPLDGAALANDLARLMEQRATLSAELFSLTKRVRDARAELVQTDELALLQEVGYYQYSHPLDDAVAYRERLEALRDKIKMAIRGKTAVRSRPGWMVNGSAKEGAALVRDFSALMLRAYNVEADNCVRTVRPHSIEVSTKRLDRTRDAILKLGASMGVAIDDGYHEMRVRELRLTTDFQAKVDQEKEDNRAARERLREEAKALAELHREEARLLKERSHYETVLARLLEGHDTDAQEQIRQHIRALDEGLAGVRAREANTRAGYVYVISNPGGFGEVMVKIGMTRRLDPMDRVRELGNASVPFRYDVHALIFSADALGLEAALHTAFSAQRVNRVNLRREFFYVSPAAVRQALLQIGRDHVLEYTDTAEALEWRQSQDARPTVRSAAEPSRTGVQLRRGGA